MSERDSASRMTDVLRLSLVEGRSIRGIARELSIGRDQVRRILGRAQAKPKLPPAPRPSLLDAYDSTIRAWLDDAPQIRAPAVLERLRPLGYTGGVTIVRDRLRELRPRPAHEAFLELDFKPGAALQVDWADFGFAIPDCPRRVSAFVAVLAYARFMYIEFTLSQKMGSFLRCMERALTFFGGSTLVDIFDNMRTVVSKSSGAKAEFHPRFAAYAQARGFAIVACNRRRGNEKGRVERPIGFVRTRFWPGRRFRDLLDLNTQATAWRDDFANRRVHEVTGKVPSLVYEHEEKPLLKALCSAAPETDDIESMPVTKTCRLTFDRNRYSIPWRLVCQSLVVRANDDHVSLWLGKKQVALHARCWSVGQTIIHPSHDQTLREEKVRATGSYLPPALVGLGEPGTRYFKLLAANSRSIHREAVRLVFLSELFGEAATAAAMEEVMKTGHVGSEYVEYVMRHKKKLSPLAAPVRLGDPELDNIHFNEPDLSVYDRPVKTIDPGTLPGEAEEP